MILLNFNQQRFEADFRFSMVRVRENSESIALYGGEKQENTHLTRPFLHSDGKFLEDNEAAKALFLAD